MSKNEIKLINSHAFIGLHKLKELHLHHNELMKIDDDFAEKFAPLSQLKILIIGKNRVKELSVNALVHLENLEELYLHHNDLRKVRARQFHKNKRLRKLNLSMNRIEIVDEQAFVGIEFLEELNLSNNKLNIINSNTFASLRQLKKLNLKFNLGPLDAFE